MAKKNKQQIKFETDITGLKKGIKEGEESIRSLTKELKLNQEQLKGNKDNIDLLETRVKTLQEQYEKQTKVVEQSNEAYEKAVEMLGENSEEARKWKDRIVEAETKQQKIKNAIDETNQAIEQTNQAIEQTNKELKIQNDRLITNGKKWEETGGHITKLGDKINSLGNKLSVISAGTATIATVALKASIDYESAFAGVEKTVDATDEQLAKLKTGILDMSTRMPAAATEIAGVAEAAGQLGIQTDNILGFSEAMIGLGESTNLTSTEAATQLARFANIMQMSQEDFDRLGSSIVDLGNNFATTEADIVNMAMRLAGAGKQVGLSEGQVLGLSAALSSVGVEAEMGGSAISKAMVKMQNAVEMGGEKLNTILDKTGMSLRDLELLSANDSKHFKKLADSIGMTSTELNQFVTAGANLEDFAKVAGMSAEEFKKAWKEDAAGALTSFIKGLGDAESKGESAITMLTEMGLTEVRLRDSLLRAANAGDLFNSAIETGTKAWKENTALSNEVNKRYKTTESQLKMLKNEATKTAIEFGNELAPSLRQVLKDAKPLLAKVSDAVKKFSELDDKTKQNVIRIGTLVAVLGPTTKAVGGLTKALGTGIKGVGNFSQAIGNLNTGAKGTTTEVKTMMSVISGLTSPVGIATLGVTALAGAWAVGKMQAYAASEETRKFTKAVKDNIKAREESIQEYENEQNATLSQMEQVKKITDELELLVDENGKVKEGYKDRVNVILNELNKALGTEFSMTGDLIDNYKKLKQSVDDLVLSKQINAIMSKEEKQYNDAINNKSEAYNKMIEAQQKLAEAQEKLTKQQQEFESKYGNHQNDNFWEKLVAGFTIPIDANNELVKSRNEVERWTQAVHAATELYEGYVNDTIVYTKTATVALSDDVESQKKLIQEKTIAHKNGAKDTGEALKYTIENYFYDLNMYKKYKDEALAKQDESSAQFYQTQIESNEKMIAENARGLAAMISVTEEMTPEQIRTWKQLADGSVDIYETTLSELNPTIAQKIRDAVDEVDRDTTMEESFKQLGQKSITGFSANNFMKAGQSAVQKLAEGMQSQSGILGYWARVVSNSSSGHADGLAYVPYNNYIARLHEGERVLTKKENQDYTRSINNNSQSVVVNIYPQTMTEQEMKKVSNFIEREWGRRS